MSVPATIGRYRIVGHLAAGGMAEILLAKVFGPAGFEQAVVLKRILPHLLRQKSFAEMFVDEATIVAGINHPNVVRVFELGKDEGELYLVMEYLEGEALHGVMKRLSTRERHLDHALGAFVVAEACAGLHAAHEMCDLDGKPRNLVHRDISPQNLFVTYGGAVKLLDFGIAKAADRITRTEAGEIKGKFAYMSPEQVDGKPLDRRSDIFSIGTVLYEATTNRRLFQRASAMLTMRAITERPIRPPSETQEGYPPALEAVVMRALERDPARRFQTAADMRRALLEVVRDLHPVAPEEHLASVMHELFADRIEEKREMLRRISAGSEVTHVPSAEVDVEVELPSIAHPDEDEEESGVERPPLPETVVEQSALAPRRSRATAWIVALALLAVAGVAGVWALGREPSQQAPEPTVATAPGGEGARPAAGATPSTAAVDPAAPAAGQDASPTADAGERARAAGARQTEQTGHTGQTVTLHVTTRPTGALVTVDGERRGRSPLDVELPRGDEAVVVTAHRGGRHPASTHVVPDTDRDVMLRLHGRRRHPSGQEPEIERFH